PLEYRVALLPGHERLDMAEWQASSYAEQCILAEYAGLKHARDVDGIYLLPVQGSLHVWDGVLFPSLASPFSGGLYRFVVDFGPSYPFVMPVIRFTTAIAHPLVDEFTGKLDTRLCFPHDSWNGFGFVSDVLSYLKLVMDFDAQTRAWIKDYLFDRLERESLKSQMHLTSQRGVSLFLESLTRFESETASSLAGNAFLAAAKDSSHQSYCRIYDEPDSEIRFSPWDIDKNQIVHDLVLKGKDVNTLLKYTTQDE
ncbi:hypothetical protein HDU91_000559, partial [Kappamyces sp. JEL0680]